MKKLLYLFLVALLAAGLPACQRKKAGAPRASGPGARKEFQQPEKSNVSKGTPLSYSRVAHVNTPFIAITFDDGPHATNTPRLLDILAARKIKATFFCVGANVARYPNIVRRIVADGHEMANHTWTHPKLSSLGDSGVRNELNRATEGIVRVAGVTPRMYRPPYGAITARQKQFIMNEYGYPTILWSVDPQDWKRPGPPVITSRILAGTQPGAIILVHDIHAPSIDAMPATLDGLLAKGYRFVTCSQLIEIGKGKGTGPVLAASPTALLPAERWFTPGSF